MRKLIFILLAACGGYSVAPTADVTAATPDALVTSDDTMNDLTITVKYSDADGDLGGGTAEVHDCRADALVTMLAIPAIAPPAVVADKSAIDGELDLHVDDIGAADVAAMPATCSDLGVAALDTSHVVFCVVLVDAAGHRGPGSCTQPIEISATAP
jgi:hypothetical protein